jgi:hypothetical protein
MVELLINNKLENVQGSNQPNFSYYPRIFLEGLRKTTGESLWVKICTQHFLNMKQDSLMLDHNNQSHNMKPELKPHHQNV